MRYLTLLIILVVIFGCKKPGEEPVESSMPPRTQTGENMLAFKMNGEIQFYDRKSTYLNASGVYLNTKYKRLNDEIIFISATKPEYKDYLSIEVYTWNIELNKEYIFSADGGDAYAEYYVGSSNNTHHTKDGLGSIVFKRFDSLVVAGEFHFTTFLDGSKFEITEGFFDISRLE